MTFPGKKKNRFFDKVFIFSTSTIFFSRVVVQDDDGDGGSLGGPGDKVEGLGFESQ